jgi:hypothetical protein
MSAGPDKPYNAPKRGPKGNDSYAQDRRRDLLVMNESWTAVIAVLVALLLSVSCGRNAGTASLVNNADEPISRATLNMSWGEQVEVTNLGPSKTATVTYRVREGDFRIEVVFRSGKRLETDTFCVTSGFDFQDEIAVT